MPTQKKIFTVQNLTEKFKQAKGLVLADYSGLAVGQLTELRQAVKKTEAELEVIKNSLFQLAAKEADFSLPKLNGQTAVLWLYQEDLTPLKTLDQFIQKNDLPKIKFGFWQGKEISLEKIKELAHLPTFNQLRANLVGLLQSPLFGLHQTLNGNIQKLIYILSKKGGEENG